HHWFGNIAGAVNREALSHWQNYAQPARLAVYDGPRAYSGARSRHASRRRGRRRHYFRSGIKVDLRCEPFLLEEQELAVSRMALPWGSSLNDCGRRSCLAQRDRELEFVTENP